MTNLVTPTAANPPLVTPLTFTGRPIRLDNALAVAGPAGLAPEHASTRSSATRAIQCWNVNVQRELWPNFGVMVGLLRVEGRPPARVAQPEPVPGARRARPFPRLSPTSPILPGTALGNITEVTSLGLLALQRALDHASTSASRAGCSSTRSYTLSESKDTNSLNSQGVVVQDSTNVAGDYALSDFDARHRYRR